MPNGSPRQADRPDGSRECRCSRAAADQAGGATSGSRVRHSQHEGLERRGHDWRRPRKRGVTGLERPIGFGGRERACCGDGYAGTRLGLTRERFWGVKRRRWRVRSYDLAASRQALLVFVLRKARANASQDRRDLSASARQCGVPSPVFTPYGGLSILLVASSPPENTTPPSFHEVRRIYPLNLKYSLHRPTPYDTQLESSSHPQN